MMKLFRNCRYLLIRLLGDRPILFRLLWRVDPFDELVVEKDTGICIEGFPRSANSFLTLCFSSWNPQVKTAHHLHLPFQIRMAAKYGIPTIVVIRHPLDAVSSLLVRENFLYPWVALKSYLLFYAQTRKFLDKIVVAEFETCISDPGRLVKQVNAKFGTSFTHGDLSEELNRKLFSEIDFVNSLNLDSETSVSRPSPLKNTLKDKMSKQVIRYGCYRDALKNYQVYVAAARRAESCPALEFEDG